MYPICYIYMHKHVYIIIRSKVVVLLFYLGSQKHAGVANQSLENSPQNTGYALNKNIDGRMNHHGTPLFMEKSQSAKPGVWKPVKSLATFPLLSFHWMLGCQVLSCLFFRMSR